MKKKFVACLLAGLMLLGAAALADGGEWHESRIGGSVRLTGYTGDYNGYVSADGLGGVAGADDGYVFSDRRLGGADVLATSYTLSQAIQSVGDFDLILCGKQTTDGDTAQVGSEISEALSLPAVAGVLRILSAEAEAITVEMDLTDKVETVRVSLPCLLSVEKDITQPRLPSYVRKQAMKDAPIHRLTLADMEDTDPAHYGLSGSPTQVQRIFPPESNHKQEKWTGTGPELAGRLFGLLKEQKLWQGGR